MSKQTSVTAYQNRHNGQQTSGNANAALNEQHGNTSPTGLQNLDISPTIQETPIAHNDQTQGEIGVQTRSGATTRASSVAAYQNMQRRPLQPELDASDVNTGDQNATPPTMTQDRDTMPSTEHWPSHARICRTRPEDAGKKFGRGVLKGLKAARRHYENGSDKLPIQFSTRFGGAIGINYRTFVDEVTIYMKRHAPLIGVKTWSDIDKDAKSDIVKDTLELWDLQDTPENSKKILRIANERYRGWRSTLHATYKCYNTDELRRRNKPDDVGVEEWDYLMEYFGTDAKFQEKSNKNAENRKKRKATHCMGSMSYSQLSYVKRNPETGQEPDDIELWELGHLKNGVWSNTESQVVHENACAVVAEKEREEGRSVSMEERNDIFHIACRTALGTRNSYAHGRGYMARPLFSQSLRSQMTEQVIATSETQRQNEELRNQVRSLQDRNEELDQHIQGLDEQNQDLVDQVQTLGYKNEELNGQVQSMEGQMEKDRAERLKEMEIFKENMRQEMTKMIASHSSAAAGKNSQPKKTERNSKGSIAQGSLLKGKSSQHTPHTRIISPYRLRQTVTKEMCP